MIVAMVRDIIDTVKPIRSFYTLETMPWMLEHLPIEDEYRAGTEASNRSRLVRRGKSRRICCQGRLFWLV
jgi:hypothetical protein